MLIIGMVLFQFTVHSIQEPFPLVNAYRQIRVMEIGKHTVNLRRCIARQRQRWQFILGKEANPACFHPTRHLSPLQSGRG